MKKILFTLSVSLLFFIACSKSDSPNDEPSNGSFKVKYEIELSSFEDCRLQVLGIRDNSESIGEILEKNVSYEFTVPKDYLLSVTGVTVNKDNEEPKIDSKAIVTIRIYINGRLVRNASERYINTQVVTTGKEDEII